MVRAVTTTLSVGVALGLSLTLAACTNSAPAPTEAPAVTESASPTATAAPALVLDPDASAAANLAYFDSVASAVTAIDGRSYVDALTAAGFDKTQMEVTFDRTEVDLAADTIQFAVRFNGECLLGQNGPASGGYHSAVTAPLASGTCLVGTTRSIDW
ncbi:hypothetical protein E3T55_01870 [Cryobacterium frigoriphilum]|uniref:DUF6993 domain-containing protein n=2 Tax=Cryobacterium frigoriphilum TaxID=1259150 RepID=A0A4V6QIC7_9MICO|nr:hypothetical protein E3T55_01870 [Cryobacterium frigoriphilum]